MAPTATPTSTAADRENKAKLRALAAAEQDKSGRVGPFPRVPEFPASGTTSSLVMARANRTPTPPGMHALNVAALEEFPSLPPWPATFSMAPSGRRGTPTTAAEGEMSVVPRSAASLTTPMKAPSTDKTVAATVAPAPTICKPPPAPKGVGKPKKLGAARGSRHPANLHTLATLASAAIKMADEERVAKAQEAKGTKVSEAVGAAAAHKGNAGAGAGAVDAALGKEVEVAASTSSSKSRAAFATPRPAPRPAALKTMAAASRRGSIASQPGPQYFFARTRGSSPRRSSVPSLEPGVAPIPARPTLPTRGGGAVSANAATVSARRGTAVATEMPAARHGTPAAVAPLSGDGVIELPIPPPPARAVTPASPIGVMVSKAVVTGNRPLREDLSRLERQVNTMATEIVKLGEKIDAQGEASNKVAGAVELLIGKVDVNAAKVEKGVAAAVVSAGAAMDAEGAEAERIAEEIATLDRVRTALREHHGSMLVGTNTSDQVLPSPPAALDAMLGVTMQTLDVTNEEAHDWLMHYVPKKARLGKGGKLMKPGKERARTALLRVLPHLLQYVMSNLMGIFFNGIEVVPRELTPAVAAHWCVDLAYGKSVLGRRAVMAMRVMTYDMLGVTTRRVHLPTTAGGAVHIDSTVGLYGLMTTFARHWLDIGAGLRAVGRNGTAITLYDEWRAELPRVDSYLATDNDVHDGLRLVDGKDVLRSFILPEAHVMEVEDVNDETEGDHEGAIEEGCDEEEA